MRAVLVINGVLALEVEGRLRAAIAEADVVIGVDGGTHHLSRLDLMPPHLIIQSPNHPITPTPAFFVAGDFDSLTPGELGELAGRGVRIAPTPDQNYTDFDKALTFAIEELGATEIRVFAASGGRLDHLYSVLSALIKHGRRGDIRLVDETGETWLCGAEEFLSDPDLPGRTLSLMAFGPVHGVTTTGLRWPLTDESLAPGVRDGTLNEVTEETVTVRVGAGDLLILLHHRDFSDALWKAKAHGNV